MATVLSWTNDMINTLFLVQQILRYLLTYGTTANYFSFILQLAGFFFTFIIIQKIPLEVGVCVVMTARLLLLTISISIKFHQKAQREFHGFFFSLQKATYITLNGPGYSWGKKKKDVCRDWPGTAAYGIFNIHLSLTL